MTVLKLVYLPIPQLLSTIAEFVLVGYVFGINNFLDALQEMEMDFKSGNSVMRAIGWFWRIMICGVTPIILSECPQLLLVLDATSPL